MAGGKGERLNSGEKPLALLKEKHLIAYVLEALLESPSIGRIFVAVSPRTPETRAFVEEAYKNSTSISVIKTPGAGYHEDTVYAVEQLSMHRPFLIISSDVPLVRPATIDAIITEYEKSGTEALSVRIDRSCIPADIKTDTVLTDNGIENVPAAINIIDGRYMDRYQQEHVYIVKDPLLAANVNYMADLSVCEKLMSESSINRQVH